MAKSSIATLLATALLAACSAATKPPSNVDGTPRVQVVDDPMRADLLVLGPKLAQHQPALSGLKFTLQLGASIDRKTATAQYFVRHELDHSSSTWLFFSGATYLDAKGEPKPGSGWNRARGEVQYCSGGRCRYSESGTFNVPADEMLKLATSLSTMDGKGWRVRLNGEKAYLDGYVPGASILPFVEAVQKSQGAVAKTAVDRLARQN